MNVCVLASGSKGNSTYLASSSTKILMDIGPSCAIIESKLKEINVLPEEINAILISHTHKDHIGGLKVFMKKYHPKVYLTEKMYEDLILFMDISNYQIITGDFMINDMKINVIKTSHDVSDSNGYIIENAGKSVVYVTDTGYINIKNHSKLSNRNLYIMESNHDIEMLMKGKYPYHLKQRILSDKGHLSNKDSSYYLSHFIGENTKYIILAHLSEENNTSILAETTLIETLKKENQQVEHIIIASQKERTDLVQL